MQLCVHFAGKIDLPLAHRHYIQSMLYHLLASDQDYAAALHDGGENQEGRKFKLFTFGQLQGTYSIHNGRILFPQGAGLEIRSISDELLWRLFRKLIIGSQVRVGSNMLTVADCAFRNVQISANTVDVVTVSPVVAYITEASGCTRFFSPEENSFYTLIASNARRKWQMHYGSEYDGVFSLTPVKNTSFRKQVTAYKTTRITAWHGSFRLQADPQMLNLLYHTGLGAKSSQGFGMFSIKK